MKANVVPLTLPAGRRAARRLAWLFAILAPLLVGVGSTAAEPIPAGMQRIPAGQYHPLMQPAEVVSLRPFWLDTVPVSNGDYLKFVRANPRWRRSQIRRIFADESYLKNWSGDLAPGSNAPAGAPAVYVSWFAAKAYAQWQGKRLPTVAEWELAANASATRADGQNDPAFKNEVLRWYAESNATEFMPVDGGTANVYGVRNLHGLVWEWVSDFNSALSSSDSGAGSVDGKLFCGAGAQGASDVSDYPAFMRYAFRSSLRADYCIHNLGFRCAKDL
jgi:sulfatase modifying factor 1